MSEAKGPGRGVCRLLQRTTQGHPDADHSPGPEGEAAWAEGRDSIMICSRVKAACSPECLGVAPGRCRGRKKVKGFRQSPRLPSLGQQLEFPVERGSASAL